MMNTLITKEGCTECADVILKAAENFRVVTIPKYTGLGDLVADIIHRVSGIRPCAGCMRRRSYLNKVFPFTRKATDEQRKLMSRVLDETPLRSSFPFVVDEITGRIYPYAADSNV